METIALRCRRAFIFWMSKIAQPSVYVRDRNRSRCLQSNAHVDMNVVIGFQLRHSRKTP